MRIFLFIADDNTLYFFFSSNRLLGLGGLDVYAIKLDAPSKAGNLEVSEIRIG
jgi:hypothetical protein